MVGVYLVCLENTVSIVAVNLSALKHPQREMILINWEEFAGLLAFLLVSVSAHVQKIKKNDETSGEHSHHIHHISGKSVVFIPQLDWWPPFGDLPLVLFFVIALVDVVHKNLVGHVFGLLNKCLKAKAAALMCHAASYMELLGLATWHLIQHN